MNRKENKIWGVVKSLERKYCLRLLELLGACAERDRINERSEQATSVRRVRISNKKGRRGIGALCKGFTESTRKDTF